MGTISCNPPEYLIAGDQVFDEKSDVWLLGKILWTLIDKENSD
jgi:hypothetical protein